MQKKDNTTTKKPLSWFFKWVLNNKVVSILFITILIMVNILLLQKISGIFDPVFLFLRIIAFPVISAGILFYIMEPGVRFLLHRNVPKGIAIWTILFVAALAIVAIFSFLIPILRTQIVDFVTSWPGYYDTFVSEINRLTNNDMLISLQPQLQQLNDQFTRTVSSQLNSILNLTLSSITNVVGVVSETLIGLVTMPIILFYLLKDSHRVLPNILKIFPTKSRESISEVLVKMNGQISQYISGQITVAFFVGVMFVVGYAIIGLNYGTAIGIFAGVLNIIPYVGSFVGMVPAIVIALVTSPVMLVKVLIVFMIEQTIEGRILSPLVLGNSLKMHPVTILLILLAGGRMFGVMGLLLGIPGYAVVKVVVTSIFEWTKEYSGLYQDDKHSIELASVENNVNVVDTTKGSKNESTNDSDNDSLIDSDSHSYNNDDSEASSKASSKVDLRDSSKDSSEE